jgi:hypothetical protein
MDFLDCTCPGKGDTVTERALCPFCDSERFIREFFDGVTALLESQSQDGDQDSCDTTAENAIPTAPVAPGPLVW